MKARILVGDVRTRLSEIPDQSVQSCVTSPPYWGLRDYGEDAQIGLEQSPEEYVAELVAVFREVRRVLKGDGTLWLNLGDTFSNRVANISNLLKSEFENGIFFYGSADPRGCATERINVLIYDKRFPDSVFEAFFATQRVTIKNGQDDLCEIGGVFNTPVICWASSAFSGGVPYNSYAECFMNIPEYVGIVIATGNLHTDAALRSDISKSISVSVKHSKTSFAIEVSGEPISESIPTNVPTFESFTFKTGAESRSKINSVNDSVTFLDSSDFNASQCFDFTIRESRKEKIALALHNGVEVAFIGVSHLFLLDVGLIPYYTLLDKAQRKFNANKPKQELGIPEMVKRALMEDGWICRQTIIWAKPNPMPESVTDRCTKSHEYLFLLSKSARYYFDNEAIKEPSVTQDANVGDRETTKLNNVPGRTRMAGLKTNDYEMRNKRDVWFIGSKPFAGAHFAVMPTELVEPCILAGSKEGDTILDPFSGSGTVGLVALTNNREYLGIELNPEYAEMSVERIGLGTELISQLVTIK